jgi:uncharacterized FAD-dependent dehydrogenase
VIPKPIAVGFRVEHPQDLINQAQFGKYGQFCERGNGKVNPLHTPLLSIVLLLRLLTSRN